MKLNASKIAEAEAWVEKNGLYPQACGATVKQFCQAMGISKKTYERWQANDAFVSALSRARELFRVTTIRDVENALVKAAKGVDFTPEDIVRLNALARSELALGHKEEAAEIAKRAVELDPTAEGPRLLYFETHGRLPKVTLSGVVDE